LTDATVANTWFESLDALIEVLGRQCAWLETQHDLLTRHTLSTGGLCAGINRSAYKAASVASSPPGESNIRTICTTRSVV
jgi:hypothetical protein